MKPKVLAALLLSVAAVAAASWLIHDDPHAPGGTAAPPSGLELPPEHLALNAADIERIARLFHAEQESGGDAGASPFATRALPLRLIGTIAGATPYDGVATIETLADAKIGAFLTGQNVTPEIILVAVLRTRAVLRVGKDLIELHVTPAAIASNARPSPPPPAPKPASWSQEGVEIHCKPGDAACSADMTQAAFNDITGARLPEIITQALATPVVEEGKVTGYKLSRILPNSVFEHLDFHDGDIVTSVNDFPLGDPVQALRVLQGLRKETSFSIRGVRGGVAIEKTVTVH